MIDTPAAPAETLTDHAQGAGLEPSGTDMTNAIEPAEPIQSSILLVELDPAWTGVARAAAAEDSGSADRVGELLRATQVDDVAVEVVFASHEPGYDGWTWSVVLAVLPDQSPTVSEVVMLPSGASLMPPPWIPWDRRIRPGDVGPGDLLPPPVDDLRIVPAYLRSDDPAIEELATEVGLGRIRVLSRWGREDAAERWHEGPFGPAGEMAQQAPATCVTCAFYLPLAGSLGALLGACGNEYSPADGRVVDAESGCGAHSETVIVLPPQPTVTDSVIDELLLDIHARPAAVPPAESGQSPDSAGREDGFAATDDEEPGQAAAGVVDDADPDEVPDPTEVELQAPPADLPDIADLPDLAHLAEPVDELDPVGELDLIGELDLAPDLDPVDGDPS